MRWLALPLVPLVLIIVLAGLAYGLWPRESASRGEGFDASALAGALAEMDKGGGAGADAEEAELGETLTLEFPRDHGAHPGAPAELWELTAVLHDTREQPVAVRLSLARLRLAAAADGRASAFAADALLAGEWVVMAGEDAMALSGLPVRAQRLSRTALGLAGAGADEAGGERVWIERWALSRTPEGGLALHAEADGIALELSLSSLKPPVVLDRETLAGAPEQGASPVQSYSQSRLAASGTLRAKGGEQALQGVAWLDHGWGALAEALAGGRGQLVANRFQLQLNDGSELACLHLRRRGGGGTPIPSCVLIGADGETQALRRRELTLAPTEAGWVTEGGVEYPLGWRLLIPAHGLELEIEPLLGAAAGGMASGGDAARALSSASIAEASWAWRGAVRVSGRRESGVMSGSGQMDLNGYGDGSPRGT
jgi:predicted secreted hydrolase